MPNNKIKVINKQFIIQSINLWLFYYFIVTRQWDIYRQDNLRQDCKYSKLFMYLKRAPASSSHAVLWCGISYGPSAAGVYNSDIYSFGVGLGSHNLKKARALWNHCAGLVPIVQISQNYTKLAVLSIK